MLQKRMWCKLPVHVQLVCLSSAAPGPNLPSQAFVSVCLWAPINAIADFLRLRTDSSTLQPPLPAFCRCASYWTSLLCDLVCEICMSLPVVGICRRQDLPQSCSCGFDKLRKQPASRLLHRQHARRRRRRVCLQATNTLFSKLFAG